MRPGVKTDGLYTDCTLAINPDTGKLVWYYQHLPNDQWDLDWVFERQIVRMPVNGVVRPVIMTSGKQATYDILDAETGKWICSKDLGLQNIVSSIDPVTGKKTINPQTLPGDGQDDALSAPMWTAPRAGCRVRTIRTRRLCMCRWLRRAWI